MNRPCIFIHYFMNLILIFSNDFIPGTSKVLLTGRRQAHVLDIHRAAVGDRLVVGVLDGKIGQGCITRLTTDALEMDVVLQADPPSKIPVVLCVAMMRPIVFKRVLLTAVTMGVEAIHVFHSKRVEKSFWKCTALLPEEIRDQLILGLEQAKDTVMPQVVLHQKFKPFVEDVMPSILCGRQGIVADPSGSGVEIFKDPKVLVVGPEGGFIPYELDKFHEAGCVVFGLGPRILRVETAVTSLLSRLSS
ncbi:MAG: 16S rRNA (uracil(1498)-N(3))-methyltransferase [Candidatus Omnitrophota bacterium]